MELWLIRHGLPQRIDGGAGPADPSLAPDGIEQARLLADRWSAFGLDAVCSSPQRRAFETAVPLAEATGCGIAVHDGLREFDAHLEFYVPLEELRQDEAAWARMLEEWRSPEAEAQRQRFRDGVVETIGAIAAAHRGGRVAAVCHGGVINAYVTHVLGLQETIFFEPAYTSVSRVLVSGEHTQVVSLNETAHLPGLVLPTKI